MKKYFPLFVTVLLIVVGLGSFVDSSAADVSDGLVAYYPFDGNAVDASGYGYDGTIYGAVLTSDRMDVADSAYAFNGFDNAIVVLDPNLKLLFPQGSDLSLSAWVRLEGYNSDHTIIVAMESGINVQTRAALRVNSAGIPYYFALAEPRELYAPEPLTLHEWHHVAAVHTGDDAKLYIDGELVAHHEAFGALSSPYTACTDGGGGLPFQNKCVSLAIGAWTDWWGVSESVFPGRIDEVRVYQRPLTADEVAELADTGCGVTIEMTSVTSDSGRDDSRIMAEATVHNSCAEPVAVEAKAWLVFADGSTEAMPGFRPQITIAPDEDMVMQMRSGLVAAGSYEVYGRLLDPITGDHLSTDSEMLIIEE